MAKGMALVALLLGIGSLFVPWHEATVAGISATQGPLAGGAVVVATTATRAIVVLARNVRKATLDPVVSNQHKQAATSTITSGATGSAKAGRVITRCSGADQDQWLETPAIGCELCNTLFWNSNPSSKG